MSAPLEGDCDLLGPALAHSQFSVRTSAPLEGDCDRRSHARGSIVRIRVRTSAPLEGDCDLVKQRPAWIRVFGPNECAARRRLRLVVDLDQTIEGTVVRTSAPLEGDCDFMGCDVTDDRRRQRVSDALLDFGTRVQESVFQCRVEPSRADEMLARIRRTIEETTDKVHVLALCDACGGRVTHYGIAQEASDPGYLIL